jgi:hypothetical protein
VSRVEKAGQARLQTGLARSPSPAPEPLRPDHRSSGGRMYRGSWRRWHGQATAERPLLRTRTFATAEMATEAHVWRSACSAIDGKSGVLTSPSSASSCWRLALAASRTVASALSNTPPVLTQRQMPALTTREQEARPSGVPRRVRAPVHDVTVWSRCPFPRFLVLRRMLARRGR